MPAGNGVTGVTVNVTTWFVPATIGLVTLIVHKVPATDPVAQLAVPPLTFVNVVFAGTTSSNGYPAACVVPAVVLVSVSVYGTGTPAATVVVVVVFVTVTFGVAVGVLTQVGSPAVQLGGGVHAVPVHGGGVQLVPVQPLGGVT